MRYPLWNKDWFIGLLLMLVFLGMAQSEMLRALEWRAYDLGLQFSAVKQANPNIVVVSIDDQSLREHGAWPWPRSILAEATRKLARLQPDVVGFALPFDVAQNNRNLEQVDKLKKALVKAKAMRGKVREEFKAIQSALLSDQVLASRFRTSRRVVLAMPYGRNLAPIDDEATPFPQYLNKFTLSNVEGKDTLKDDSSWFQSNPVPVADVLYPPIEVLSKQVGGVGVINFADDDIESTRREPLVVRYADRYLPSFALMLAVRYQHLATNRISAKTGDSLKVDGKTVQTDRELHIYPRYYKNDNGKSPFKVFSMSSLLAGAIDADELRGKIVIIGITSKQHAKPQMTPIGEAMTAPLIIAHTVSSLLNEELYNAPNWTRTVQALMVIGAGLYLMFLLPNVASGTGHLISLLMLIALFNIHLYFMISASTWVPLMTAILTLIIGHLMFNAKHFIENRIQAVYSELSAANHQLGQTLQVQGKLDEAFEKYRACRIDSKLLNRLYNLGLDYERKRQFNKAISVFEFIQAKDSHFNDIEERLQRNREASNTLVLSGGNGNSSQPDLLLGKSGLQKPMLGRYQIEKEIGKGAMGTVYLGHDPKISRTVAIKTLSLSDEFEDGELEEVRARFFREAEAAGRLNHSNIVTVYDIGEEQDLAYIAMDYLQGNNLSIYCKKEHLLPTEQVLDIIMQVARALDYAHEKHVVHRDVKPANIIYDKNSGVAKVTDFGVACLTDASKTKTGTVLGSPYYMSPEQITGDKVDGRSDLFSLGVTLYQMLSGELPFTGVSMANLMYRIANERYQDIRLQRTDLEPCLVKIVNRALHKDIDKRFQSGKQMAAAIKRCNHKMADTIV